MSTSYCVFSVSDQRVGIPMASVREIIETNSIALTPVPLAPDFVRGLFNLRGQVLPYLDLHGVVGATTSQKIQIDRAVIVERGEFRFATAGEQIDTVVVDEASFQPLADGALFPALEAEVVTERGTFRIIHLDRLEASLAQALRFSDLAEVPDAFSSPDARINPPQPAEVSQLAP